MQRHGLRQLRRHRSATADRCRCPLRYRVTGAGSTVLPPRAQVIHIDIDAAEVGKCELPELPIRSRTLRLALEALLQPQADEPGLSAHQGLAGED